MIRLTFVIDEGDNPGSGADLPNLDATAVTSGGDYVAWKGIYSLLNRVPLREIDGTEERTRYKDGRDGRAD